MDILLQPPHLKSLAVDLESQGKMWSMMCQKELNYGWDIEINFPFTCFNKSILFSLSLTLSGTDKAGQIGQPLCRLGKIQ